MSRTAGGTLSLGAITLLLLVSACSTQVAGMQAPVQHDYDAVDWIPLNGAVQQAFIISSGYTAAVQNDPDTTPAQLLARIERLPEAATGGRLSELRVGIRPVAGTEQSTSATVSVYLIPESELGQFSDSGLDNIVVDASNQQSIFEANLSDLPAENNRIVIEDLPDLAAESLGIIVITAGPDSSGWEFGVSRWRAPYGGWKAASNEELSGAMLFETIYDQQIDTSGVVSTGLDQTATGLNRDLGFTISWLVVLLTIVIAGSIVLLRPKVIGDSG